MNRAFLYIFKTYIYISLILGFFLFLFKDKYLFGYFIGLIPGFIDLSMLYISFRRKNSLTYTGAILGMISRLSVVTLIFLFLFFCDIINKLSIRELMLGIMIYPVAIFIGGIKVIRWKR